MSFSGRLLLTSLVTLAVGLGALVVAGNVLLDRRVSAEVSNELRVNAQAQLATLSITSAGVTVREAPNDEALDRRGWVIEGDRVIERATNVSPALNRKAVALGRARAFETTTPMASATSACASCRSPSLGAPSPWARWSSRSRPRHWRACRSRS